MNTENLFLLPSGELGFFAQSMGYPHYRKFNNQSDFTIEQCTGLKDKNGNLIYEGDIVRFCNVEMLVEWSGASCRFVLKYLEKNHPLYGYRMSMCLSDDITFFRNEYEIIGNIHEMEKDK